MIEPCVGCGYCCKKAPCGFGEPESEASTRCRHLEPNGPVYRCGKYEEIRKAPGSEFSPAFGAGCSSPLFNEDRRQTIRALENA